MRWRMFSQAPFDRFGRLDWLAKYAMVAAEMLGMPVDPPQESRPVMAVLLGTRHGSLSVDMAFHQSIHNPGGASPMLFPYTLPSAAMGEIAIRFRIIGPSVCFVGGPQSGPTVLRESVDIVQSGEVDACVCVACDAVTSAASYLAAGRPCGDETIDGASYAFLVETEDSAAGNARRPLADVRISATEPVADADARTTWTADRKMLGALCAFLSETDDGRAAFRLDAPAAAGTQCVLSFLRRC